MLFGAGPQTDTGPTDISPRYAAAANSGPEERSELHRELRFAARILARIAPSACSRHAWAAVGQSHAPAKAGSRGWRVKPSHLPVRGTFSW